MRIIVVVHTSTMESFSISLQHFLSVCVSVSVKFTKKCFTSRTQREIPTEVLSERPRTHTLKYTLTHDETKPKVDENKLP